MIHFILNKLFWGFYRHFASDEQYVKIRFWLNNGYRLKLDKPVSLAEKINLIKLYDRTPIRKKAADRLEVRELVRERAGSNYLIPLIGAYEELNVAIWSELPQKVVLKANHGSGMIAILRNKDEKDAGDLIRLTKKWQNTDYAAFGREWVYSDLPRKIIAEKLLETNDGSIPDDFKLFCFHGRVELIQIDFDRYENHRRNFYDRSFRQVEARILYDPYEGEVEKPENFDELINVAEKLSAGFNFIRVDLYNVNGQIYFGELTNFPGNGFEPFFPPEFDRKMGSKLHLQIK